MKRLILQVLLVSGAFALTTAAIGWLAVPLLAVLWGVLARRKERPGLVALLAAGLGWAWLLIWNAAVGEARELMAVAGGVMGLPGSGFAVLTLAFPMVMAWGGAVVGGAVKARTSRSRQGVADTADGAGSPIRPLLRGEIVVQERTWQVREERRQGPRPQIFILTAADVPQSEIYIRPLPGQVISTLDEVRVLCVDPDTRVFFDVSGKRWEARIVIASTDAGETRLIKLLSYEAGGQVFEQPYPYTDGLGLRTDNELRELVAGARQSD